MRDKELEKQYTEYRNQLNKEGKIVYIPLGERELAQEIEQRGITIGKEQCITIGMEKGKEEVVRELLAYGIPVDVIAKSTGFSLKKIRSLAK